MSERPILALHLLLEQEKGTASRWYPFLQSIPASYNTVEFWTEEEVEQLQLPSLVKAFPRVCCATGDAA